MNNRRRQFIRTGVKTLTGAGLALGASPWHTLARAAAGDFQQHQDYRALVCIYLSGGSDGFSLLVPTGGAEYQEYAQSRQHLAAQAGSLIPLTANNTNIPAVAAIEFADPNARRAERGVARPALQTALLWWAR